MHKASKKLRFSRITALLLLSAMLFLPLRAYSLPGSAEDPLVSKSWVDNYVESKVSALEQQAKELIQQAKVLMQREIVLRPASDIAFINGKAYKMDTAPKIIQTAGGGITMVPLRFIGEALNIAVAWDSKSGSIICTDGKTTAVLPLDGSPARINNIVVVLQAEPVTENGRTLVPLRFISQAFHCSIGWDSAAAEIKVKNY